MRERFEFAEYVLDAEARELRRGGRAVEIEPKAFELLLLLAGRPGHAFSKEEIAGALWPGRIISDSVIAQCVRKARDATGDTAAAQSVIKTVHGTGYRFSAEPTGKNRKASEPVMRLYPALLAIAILLLLTAVYWLPRSDSEPRGRVIVAVLPVESAESLRENLAEGLESLLVRGISQQSPVHVISSSQTRRMLDLLDLSPSDDDETLLTALSASLGAEYLLRPRLGDTGAGYQAHAVLFGEDGYSEEIAPPPGDIVAMVRGFSRALATELGVDWRELEGASLLSADNFVNEAYARGLRAALSGKNRSAVSLFESVLHLEPGLTWARYELGFAHWQLGEIDLAREQFETALEEAGRDQVTRLAGHALTMLGVMAWHGGDLEEAERLYVRALEDYRRAGDDHAAASALGNLGILADNRGDLELAADFYLQARERFRAVHDQVGESAVYTNLAILSRLRGRLHEARRQQAQAVEIQRRLGIGSMLVRSLTYLASIEYELGRREPARELLDEAEALADKHENRHGLADIELERARRALYRLQPEKAAAHAEAAQLVFGELEIAASEAVAMSLLAESALLAGEPETAAAWLDRADETDTGISKPRDRSARILLRARAALADGRDGTAEAHLKALLSNSDPAVTARARGVLGELHWEHERYAEAVDTWRDALRELEHVDEPMIRARIRTRLARALIEQRKLDEAHRLLALVEEWNREDVGAIIQRARLHAVRNEPRQARTLLTPLLHEAEEAPREPDLEGLRIMLDEVSSGQNP